ncbi:helix-turn-helix domain-containing protein [Paraburkholderia sp.]|uniref:helix-turn-helix domain-containing protein n=1 Tax=Paraburkholderia sp. TaxID=1926495 RepID=UPI003D6E7142
MHPADISAQLRKAGHSQARIARELGVSETAVHHVVYGRSKSCRIARRICERSGLDPETAWPGRYPEFQLNPIGHAEAA